MFKTYLYICICFNILINLIYCIGNVNRADDTPESHPGHLKPLGAFSPQTEIETLNEYPTPQDFFDNYIRPGRPFLLKKGAYYHPAYKLWTDEYFKSFPEAATELVQVEPNLKEIREATGFEIPFKEFVERYHNEKVYMVNKVPSFLQKDIYLPPSLRCKSVEKLLLDHVTWMSTGGTKSVLHNDDLDNINCLLRGKKELLFINPNKYEKKVPIDRPRGGYSSLDVDKVNFTKFPGLRDVEYIHCAMEEGDCLFIPWRWYHQVNSVANKDNQNIAVNIWFKHDPKHKAEGCDIPLENATIDKFKFHGIESMYEDVSVDNSGEESSTLLDLFRFTLTKTKFGRASFKTFTSILKRVEGIFIEESIAHLDLSKDFLRLAKELFDSLNINGDKYITNEDFDHIKENGLTNDMESWLNRQINEMANELSRIIIEDEGENEMIDEMADVNVLTSDQEQEREPENKHQSDTHSLNDQATNEESVATENQSHKEEL